jgi:hypothetical protein
VLDKIGKYNRAELDQPALETVRDELYFLLGKYNYNKGKFKEAVSLFNAVSPKSEFYVQAKLFEGATHVREYEARPRSTRSRRSSGWPPRAATPR